MRGLYLYFWAFAPKLWAVLTAGALLGLDPLIRTHWEWGAKQLERIPAPHRRRIEFGLLILAIFYAGYAAWSDEHEARVKVEQGAFYHLNARHLTSEERLRFVSALRNSPISGKIEIMSTCDECEDYAQEFRDALHSVTTVRVSGGLGMFASASSRGIKVYSPSSAERYPLALRFAEALDAAALRYEWGEQKNLESLGKDYLLVVIGRPWR